MSDVEQTGAGRNVRTHEPGRPDAADPLPIQHRRRSAALAAAAIASLGAAALSVELWRTLAHALAIGQPLAEALFGYFRFFTVLTNWGVAVLMGVHALRLWRGAADAPASLFRAAAVYMVVTGATYELLLRRLWSPQGLTFWLDLVFHDVQPTLVVLFWLALAPKRDLRWRGLPWIAAYPAAYFAFTLAAGALGAGYPYDFLDAAQLGYPAVVAVGVAFLGVFLALGAAATALAFVFRDGPSATAWRRPQADRS